MFGRGVFVPLQADPLDYVDADGDLAWIPPHARGTRLESPVAGLRREAMDDAEISSDGTVRWGPGVRTPALEDLPPGPALARLLDGLDPARLSAYDLISFLGASERQASWTAARQIAAVAELSRRRLTDRLDLSEPEDREAVGRVSKAATQELALELRISRYNAESRLDLALQLNRLPETRRQLAAGRIDVAKMRALVFAVRHLTDEQAGAVEARVLPKAREQVLGDFKAALQRAVLRVDTRAAQERHERSLADRKVEFVPLENGIAGVWATMRADRALALFEGITALAHQAKGPSDGRTLDQRRSDVLADIGTGLLARDDLPRRHGRRPHLQVTVPIRTLLGLDDEPGELAGYGPIPAEVVREIAADATWTRLLVDPVSGALMDYGTSVYKPPQALADKVVAKHGRCRMPGCRMPAARCHLDHTVRYPDGPTAEGNLAPLCEPDHLSKHSPGWHCEQYADGTVVWTTPTGHVYRDEMRPVWEPPERGGVDLGPDRAGPGCRDGSDRPSVLEQRAGPGEPEDPPF